jgi:DNA-binding NtrC family response regulator
VSRAGAAAPPGPHAPPKASVLLVDDDQAVVDFLLEMFVARGYAASGVTRPEAALERLAERPFDIVVSDVEMPGMRGLELLAKVLAQRPTTLVLLITAFGSIEQAVEAVHAGACDFVTKPFKFEALEFAVERALRERKMRREIVRLRRQLSKEAPTELVAQSPVMRKAVERAERAARSDATVLLTGESGTGKGALARHIHLRSGRARGPFVQVNCAALPGPLVESELFGVRRGAFTDAREDREGLFVAAAGGTLVLDEIAEMPLEAQAKLLQVLETGRVRPTGGDRERDVDVRIVAATNLDLEQALRQQRFRADLYFRLNVVRIDLPPLRDRREDIPSLVDLLVERHSRRHGRDTVGVSQDALAWLVRYDWPGNVRELGNVIDRAIALADHDTIVLEDVLVGEKIGPGASAGSDVLRDAVTAGKSLADVELLYIRKVMDATGGNISRAARLLGINRRTLYRRLGEGPDAAPEDDED